MGYGSLSSRKKLDTGRRDERNFPKNPILWAIAVLILVFTVIGGYAFVRFINKTIPSEYEDSEFGGRSEILTHSINDDIHENGLPRVDCQRAAVLIKSESKSGSGVLVETNGRRYVYTCEHVVRCSENLVVEDCNGNELELGSFEVASNRDMARFEITADNIQCLRLGEAVDVQRGAHVTSYGNTQGADVVAVSEGRILAVGPDTIEINCEVMQGNSGGPIVDDKGKVLALVARGGKDTRSDSEGTRFSKFRRLADRVDGVSWIKMDFDAYTNQSFVFDDVLIMLNELELFVSVAGSGRLVPVVRKTAAISGYRVCANLSSLMESTYAAWNRAIDDCKVYVKLGEDYGKLDFGDGTDMLKLQYFKIETMDWINRQTTCLKDEQVSFRQSMYTYPHEAVESAMEQLYECEENIPSFKPAKKQLLDQLEGDWLLRFEKVKPMLDAQVASVETAAAKRRSEFEDDYKKIYDSIWEEKEKVRAIRRLLEQKERERKENEEISARFVRKLNTELENQRRDEEWRKQEQYRSDRETKKKKEKAKKRGGWQVQRYYPVGG